MSTRHDIAKRLEELERILSPPTSHESGREVAVPLGDVQSVRIREITSALRRRAGEPVDHLDTVLMRLLLNDYTTALAHFREVAGDAARRIDAASGPVGKARSAVRKFSRREQERRSG